MQTQRQGKVAAPLEQGCKFRGEINLRDRDAGAEVVSLDAIRVEYVASTAKRAIPFRRRSAPEARVGGG